MLRWVTVMILSGFGFIAAAWIGCNLPFLPKELNHFLWQAMLLTPVCVAAFALGQIIRRIWQLM